MKWFQHQAHAHRDAKLKKVLIKYGATGYGLYWYCIENICSDLEPALTFELEHDCEILAHELTIDTLKVQEMMLYMVKIGLFETSDGAIFCRKLALYLGDNITRNDALKAIIKQAKSKTVSDSMRLSKQEERRGEETTREENNKTPLSLLKRSDPVPVTDIVNLYHQMLPKLPKCQKITKARESAIKQRWREDLPALTNWENYFHYIGQSPFLTGRVEPTNGRPAFIANLEWITKASNYTKILEGRYHGV